jgi:peptidyl-dipeptidase A
MGSVTGEALHVEESARLDIQIRKIFSRRDAFELLRRIHDAGTTGVPGIDRQVFLLLNLFRAQQLPEATIDRLVAMEKGLEHRFNTFRAELDGERVSDNRIRQVLHDSTDSGERRRAWEASKQIGAEVEAELRDLVRLRNRAAAELGFDNYYSMMVELDELREDELFALLDDLERGTRPLFQGYKERLDVGLARRFGIASDQLRPWHYADPFFQEAPASDFDLDPWFRERSLAEMTEQFFSTIGFEIKGLLERADLYEKPGKSQHAFCISIDRDQDIRVLCNVRPNEFWMSTMLHEFGHAVYDQHIDPTLPFLLRAPAHTLTTEASAMLFGRLSKNAAWLRQYAGMSEADAREVGSLTARTTREQLLLLTRWCLVMCHMERALYRDPEQDLNGLWWNLVRRFQGLDRPEGRDAPDWASKIHFSVAPVYYHNYLLGEIMASQLEASLLRLVPSGNGSWGELLTSPRIGAHLKDRLYRSGKSIDWREAIRVATGEPLNPGAFVADLGDAGLSS